MGLFIISFLILISTTVFQIYVNANSETGGTKSTTAGKKSTTTDATSRTTVATGRDSLVKSAWDSFNMGRYEDAVNTANKCIDQFITSAEKEQERLAANNAPLPPVGSVDDTVFKEIIARGPLNDVGTSYYIVGWAQEKLGNIEEAKKSYMEAVKFNYARAWDPKGWFWSPADEAAGRLKRLN